MKVAVVGAGAIGAFVGACLARGGTETHLIARGAHLEAMQRRGVRVREATRTWEVQINCVEDPRDVGVADLVVLGLKAHAYAAAGPLLEPLLGPQTTVVAAQNGIPWWYFHRYGGPYEGRRIEAVDPGGAVTMIIEPARVIGCVVYIATEIEEPGVIRHLESTRFAIGEPDGSDSDRCREFAAAMTAGGLKCPIDRQIRRQIWLKLMGNASFNPLSALTGATLEQMCTFEPARQLVRRLMEEVLAVAEALDAAPRISIDQRIDGAAAVGAHKTSMLQDLEEGRPLEIDALTGAVSELGQLVNRPTPTIDAVHAATALLARVRG